MYKNWLSTHKLRLAALAVGTLAYFGCSNVKFAPVMSQACIDYNDTFGPGACILTPSGESQFTYTVRVGDIDILFVNDNSGSMYVEQDKVAKRFQGFLNSLINYNYQIAMITTDISASPNNPPRAVNQNGALQDGRFIAFPNGEKILANPSGDLMIHNQNIDGFKQTVRRPETLVCDNAGFNRDACPSGDERGVYALNMALDRAENSSFFRNTGHLAVIILSDEDERSRTHCLNPNTNKWEPDCPISPTYALEEYDLPETFVKKTKVQLHSTKTVSVHSIIIPPPGTHPQSANCYQQQNNQGDGIAGHYGFIYAALSKPNEELKALGNIIEGEIGSICSNDYTQELGNIANKIKDNLNKIQLACSQPIEESIEIHVLPAPDQPMSFHIGAGGLLTLSPSIPPGSKVHLEYTCPR